MQHAEPGPTCEVFRGRVFSVTRDTVTLPSGETTVRDVVRHGASVAVVPLIAPDSVLLIKQYRFAVGEHLWEIPAGTVEADESPDQCARRELEEETGYRAASIVQVAVFYTTPGFCDETMYLFLAHGCEPTGTRRPEEDEDIVEQQLFRMDKALAMAAQGEIRDGKTIVGLAAAAGIFGELLYDRSG